VPREAIRSATSTTGGKESNLYHGRNWNPATSVGVCTPVSADMAHKNAMGVDLRTTKLQIVLRRRGIGRTVHKVQARDLIQFRRETDLL